VVSAPFRELSPVIHWHPWRHCQSPVPLSRKQIIKLDCKTVFIFGYSITYARAVKQKVWNNSENRQRDWGETLRIRFFLSPHTPFGRVRFARFARVRLLRHALPISLLILRKNPTVLQSIIKSTENKSLYRRPGWNNYLQKTEVMVLKTTATVTTIMLMIRSYIHDDSFRVRPKRCPLAPDKWFWSVDK